MQWAIIGNRMEIVKYLLFSPELTEHINIHDYKDKAFETALRAQKMDILEYFIFDLNIQKTEYIEDYIYEFSKWEVEDMFNRRELKTSLDNELSVNDNNIKKNKL
jgi:phage pi2 protein 07